MLFEIVPFIHLNGCILLGTILRLVRESTMELFSAELRLVRCFNLLTAGLFGLPAHGWSVGLPAHGGSVVLPAHN